jgi:hypothetical protein
MRYRKQLKHNPVARLLADNQYHKRIVKNKKNYNRKGYDIKKDSDQ